MKRPSLALSAMACVLIACGDDETASDHEHDSDAEESHASSAATSGSKAPKGGSSGTPDAGDTDMPNPPDQPEDTSMMQSEPAADGPVVIGAWVRGADINHTFLLASKDAPAGKIDLKDALELPDGTLTSYEDAVYFFNWDTAGIDRYEVDAKLALQKTGSLSLQNYGITAPFSWQAVFFSETRAYYVDPEEARIIVWNPKEMTIDVMLEAPELARTGYSLELGNDHRIDDRIIVSAVWSNEDSTDIAREATALILVDDEDAPVQVLDDPRCPGTRSSFADDKGDVYALGDGYGGYLAMGLGVELPKPCMLRIKRGEQRFDPDYQFDVAEAAKASAMQGLWHLSQRKFIVQSWPDSVDRKSVIMDSEDYWSAEVLQWKLVDLDTSTISDVDGIDDSAPYQLIEFKLDGVSYVLKHEETDSDAGRSFLYALDAATMTAKQAAEVSGDFWFLGRLTGTTK